MKLNVETAGLFKLEAVNALTGERRTLADWFPNLITDQGLNRMGTGGFVQQCSVGSGQNPPTISDTALQSQVAATSNIATETNGVTATAPYYGYVRRTFTFGLGAAAGNLSEVGIGWVGGLYSRSLIKDVNGTPTTVTVLANEFLSVTYEWRSYVPSADATFTATIAGNVHNCTLRPMAVTSAGYIPVSDAASAGVVMTGTNSLNASAHSGGIGSVTQFPSGARSSCGVTALPYSNNSLVRDAQYDWGLTDANFGAGGILSMSFGSTLGGYQVEFSPPIAKDNTKTLRIIARVGWARKAI